jgi:CheY-like chemotaxis protein
MVLLMTTRALRISLSAVLITLAATRLLFPQWSEARIDVTLIALLAAALLIHLIPLERLKSFKAVGVEFGLDTPQVAAAINALSQNRIGNIELRERLERMADDLEIIRGSRVLWLDDKPNVVLNARRLLRALGVEVVTATSSEKAEELLTADQDFDLLVSDVQRQGNSYRLNQGVEIHEGVNFVVKLRRSGDPVLQNIPIIFFAAYDWERLVHFTRPAREFVPEAQLSNAVNDFLVKVVKQLASIRRRPIVYPDQKEPTPP